MPSFATSGSAQELILRNRYRKSMVFQNEDPTDAIFIKRERDGALTVSSTDHDHRLAPGSAIALNFGTDGEEAIQDRWTCKSAANTPRISWFETEDTVR